MPKFGIEEDEFAEKYIRSAFPYCTIRAIDCRNIVLKGGGLHCITWNIKNKQSKDFYINRETGHFILDLHLHFVAYFYTIKTIQDTQIIKQPFITKNLTEHES